MPFPPLPLVMYSVLLKIVIPRKFVSLQGLSEPNSRRSIIVMFGGTGGGAWPGTSSSEPVALTRSIPISVIASFFFGKIPAVVVSHHVVQSIPALHRRAAVITAVRIPIGDIQPPVCIHSRYGPVVRRGTIGVLTKLVMTGLVGSHTAGVLEADMSIGFAAVGETGKPPRPGPSW
jgi:hypothetical protein